MDWNLEFLSQSLYSVLLKSIHFISIPPCLTSESPIPIQLPLDTSDVHEGNLCLSQSMLSICTSLDIIAATKPCEVFNLNSLKDSQDNRQQKVTNDLETKWEDNRPAINCPANRSLQNFKVRIASLLKLRVKGVF